MVLFHRLMSNFHAFIGKGALFSDLKGGMATIVAYAQRLSMTVMLFLQGGPFLVVPSS